MSRQNSNVCLIKFIIIKRVLKWRGIKDMASGVLYFCNLWRFYLNYTTVFLDVKTKTLPRTILFRCCRPISNIDSNKQQADCVKRLMTTLTSNSMHTYILPSRISQQFHLTKNEVFFSRMTHFVENLCETEWNFQNQKMHTRGSEIVPTDFMTFCFGVGWGRGGGNPPTTPSPTPSY